MLELTVGIQPGKNDVTLEIQHEERDESVPWKEKFRGEGGDIIMFTLCKWSFS